MNKPIKLHHYTCRHSLTKIARAETLAPMPQAFLAEPLIWLTSLEIPNRDALGLTSNLLNCDRTEIRIDVTVDWAVPWNVYVNAIGTPKYIRKLLEEAPHDPSTWWISTSPIPLTAEQLRFAALMARAVRT